MIFESYIQGLKKINKKGRNRIALVFNTSRQMNFQINFQRREYNASIPYKRVSFKGLIKQVDVDFPIDAIIKHSQTSIQKFQGAEDSVEELKIQREFQ